MSYICFGGTPIRGKSCQAQPCRHLLQAIMVWFCSTMKALRGFRMSKKLSSTFATTFWFTFSSYALEALSTSSLCFVAFLPPFPPKGNDQGVNFLTRLLVRRVEVHMVSHFLHLVQNIFLSFVFFWSGGSFLHMWDCAWTNPLPILLLAFIRRLSIASYTISLKLFSSPRDTFRPIMSFLMLESSWNSNSLVFFSSLFWSCIFFFSLGFIGLGSNIGASFPILP